MILFWVLFTAACSIIGAVHFGPVALAAPLFGAAFVFGRSRSRVRSGLVQRQASPSDFERWCGSRFEAIGYAVRHVGGPGDFGVDFIAERGEERIAVQCKDWTGAVGLSAIQEVVAGAAHYGCGRKIVVASGSFAQSALALAASNGVSLMTADDLYRETAT